MYRAMCVIYAFMRLTDDIADAPIETSSVDLTPAQSLQHRLESLQHWKQQFRDAIAGSNSTHPLFPALTEVMSQFQIDPQWLEDVIKGVGMDLQPAPFDVYADLQQYCYHVAGTVGLCCQAVWGADLSRTRQLAISCGQAFQMTNILRDLREDARNVRCYLPAEDLAKFQCSAQDFLSQQPPAAIRELMQFQIDRALRDYQQAAQLENHLQGSGLKMFRKMFTAYYLLLCKIAKSPEESLNHRAKLSKIQKARIILTAGNRPLCDLLKRSPIVFQ